MNKLAALALGVSMVASSATAADTDIYDQVKDGYAENGGVKIHYAELGSGPAVVFIHGFPDFWYSWRHQMKTLADAGYRAVAIDQRGYNLSDKPEGVAAYAMPNLVGDVVAVIRSLGVEKATVVGHDWGGAVAWQVALNAPQVVDKLIILNLPHPMGMSRELATNEEQQKNSAYARGFQTKSASDPDVFFGMPLRPETMSGWVRDAEAKKRYVEAFSRTDLEATLNYYKANYPREPYDTAWKALQDNPLPKVQMPVLQFHGLNDTALNARGLNDTWSWLEKDLTLVTVPGASHFVQQDAPELVSETMRWWLDMRRD
jgi:epoxide hydrolase 4